MEVIDLERRFLEAAKLHGRLMKEDPSATGLAYDRATAARTALESLPDRGQHFLVACLADSDSSVVKWAAVSLLPDKRAIEALERVSQGDDFVAFDAGMILEEWRAGRFKPD